MIERGARILTVLAIAGRDRAWLQRATGLGVNTISRLLHDGRQTPAAGTLRAVAQAAGVSVAWLRADGARRTLSDAETDDLRRCLRTLQSIARGRRLDARTVSNVRPEPARRVPRAFRLHGARQVYRVIGDSLARAGLLDGDLVYVRPAGRVRDAVGAHVVARLNGALYLERLTVTARGRIALVSDAEGYEPIVVHARDELALIGEVIGAVREGWNER